MPDSMLEMLPVGKAMGSIRPPGSKSLTNRALICAALSDGTCQLDGVLDSEDSRIMLAGLQHLGFEIDQQLENATACVHGGKGHIPAMEADLFIANSGTSIRFLTAMLATGNGGYRLHGIQRMHERPIGDLANALSRLGVDVTTESPNGCPPVRIRTTGLPGGNISVAGNISSQFLSGLLMAAPNARGPVRIEVTEELVSRPYVDMTLAVMKSFGVDVAVEDGGRAFNINAPQAYRATDYAIEPDASAASYFWAAAAVTGGDVTVQGLSLEALQGDVHFVGALEAMGCQVEATKDSIRVLGRPLKGIDIDMNAISDTVQTLAAVALFADGSTRIRGVAHNRHKETDRIGDLATELRKLGAVVEEHEDGLTIQPGSFPQSTEVETYNDHRMAMSLALPGLVQSGVSLRNPGCTAKTYPHFFDDLGTLFDGPVSRGVV